MKLGFSTLGCPGWKLEQAVKAAQDLGYEGIELRIVDGEIITPEIIKANLARISKLFAGSGVQLVALDASAAFAMTDRAERATKEAEVHALLPLAAELGVPYIRVFGGRLPQGVTIQQGIENVADSLNRLAPAAEKAGVKVALETHDDFSSAVQVAEVLKRVLSQAIGALWDTLHTYRMGNTTQQVLDLMGPRIVHMHIKDARLPAPGKWDLVLLEEGEIPVREMMRALNARGFKGFGVVEWEKRWHPEIPEPEVAFPQHIRLLKGYLA